MANSEINDELSSRLQKLSGLLLAMKTESKEAPRIREEHEHDKQARREEKDKRLEQLRSQLSKLKPCREEKDQQTGTSESSASESGGISGKSSLLMKKSVDQFRNDLGGILRTFHDELREGK
ncbi:unnamed protein product [Somion occarium]|uniref:Uncharacterized protein n=1 Tax=Somion occarium TaxID=3059160 RepID=A0ABP1DZC0_9APHY